MNICVRVNLTSERTAWRASSELQSEALMINQSPEKGNQKNLTYLRVIHLSHVIDPDIPQ